MKKIDRLARQIKTAGIGKYIMQYKDKAWFYPAAGGLTGVLLASPEAIAEMKDDKVPNAIRRLILSGGLGAGVGYIGGKAIKGELSDLKQRLDSLRNTASSS